MRLGMREGFTLPAEILDGISKVIAGEQFANAGRLPAVPAVRELPANGRADRPRTPASRGPHRDRGTRHSGLCRLPALLRRRVSPARAAHDRGDGAARWPRYYADLVRYYTTLPDATPAQVHATGLAEVARIRGEMDAIIREVEFKGSFAEFLTFLRTDPQFYATSPEQLLREARGCPSKSMGACRLSSAICRAHLMACGRCRRQLAPNYTAGRYNPGAVGAAGEYWVNTYALNSRPLYVLPALTLHEAVPGHHLQGALAREHERRAGLSRQLLSAFVRRRVGPVFGEARRGDRPVSHALRTLRPPDLRDVARLPIGGRYRHARQGLERGSGRSITSPPTPRCPLTRSAPKSIVTSPGRARRSPTRSAS